MDKHLYPENQFTHQEHPPSSKFNALIQIMEEQRKELGPYTIAKLNASDADFQDTATGLYIYLDEDPLYLGGVEKNNYLTYKPETVRRFRVEYYSPSDTGYCRFEDIKFTYESVDGTNRWWARLGKDNVKGKNLGTDSNLDELNLTTINISSLRCLKSWDSMPIWNGFQGAITFSTDDVYEINYTEFMSQFLLRNWAYTVFVNWDYLGLANKMTQGQVDEMWQSGFEIGNHTLGHHGMAYWTSSELYPHASGIEHQMTQIYGNKAMLEELINYSGGAWKNRNYICKSFAYAGGSEWAWDEFSISMVKKNHIGARQTGTNQAAHPITGGTAHAYYLATWWNLRPYTVPVTQAGSTIASGTGESSPRTTSEIYDYVTTGILDFYSKGSNPKQINPWINIYWHGSGHAGDYVAGPQISSMLAAIYDHPSGWWVAPFGTVLEYWRRANGIPYNDYESWL